MEALPVEYSDDYWERRYSIKSDQIPSFLHNYSDMILRTGKMNIRYFNRSFEMSLSILGKYLNVIQQCEKSIKWPDNVKEVNYLSNPEQYSIPLEEAHAFASRTLLELIVQDRDLIGEYFKTNL